MSFRTIVRNLIRPACGLCLIRPVRKLCYTNCMRAYSYKISLSLSPLIPLRSIEMTMAKMCGGTFSSLSFGEGRGEAPYGTSIAFNIPVIIFSLVMFSASAS